MIQSNYWGCIRTSSGRAFPAAPFAYPSTPVELGRTLPGYILPPDVLAGSKVDRERERFGIQDET
jgi:hypothetical protein